MLTFGVVLNHHLTQEKLHLVNTAQEEKKPTEFGIQLFAKQKLKGYYGSIGEKMLRKYYDEILNSVFILSVHTLTFSDKIEKNVDKNIKIESRLDDTVVYRAKDSYGCISCEIRTNCIRG